MVTTNIAERAYVGMGANLGDRLSTLQTATEYLARLGTLAAVSSVYETEPVGYTDQPPFLNMVVALETGLEPLNLMQSLLDIEQELGRVRSFLNAPRTLDLDLLLYGDRVIADPGLTVPHPRMHERAFVLVPLAEVSPRLVLPTTSKTVKELLDGLADENGVRIFAPPFESSSRR
jgi:2-amino-4-hydroxy-6-hydroxymethyldihydropteridine diphosphokinase